MGLVNPSQSNAGDLITASAINTPINQLAAVLNGGIDVTNFAPSIYNQLVASAGWNTISGTMTYAANNGNKEFVLNSSVDLTPTLSPGMRFQISRSGSTPTQCMSFTAASSQYATKASPTGITFTSAFTCEAWVYLNSYPGTAEMIVSRLDAAGSNGWWLQVQSTGQLTIAYANGGNSTSFQTYQSLPLKRWVHVAGSVTSVSGKTCFMYINGVNVPNSVPVSNTTTMSQPTANLSLGTYGAPTGQYFDGYLSEVRLWSTTRTASQIQDNMAISLTGSETGLVGCWPGNGNFNDITANANNLTATGGAIATYADNPYHTTEYAVVTKVTATQLTIFTGTDYNIPNMTLTSPQYSNVKAPYGFPASRGKWTIESMERVQSSNTSSPAIGTWYNIGSKQLTVPVGEWNISYYVTAEILANTGGDSGVSTTLSTGNNTESDPDLTANGEGVSITVVSVPMTRSKNISLSAQATYYINTKIATTPTGASLYNRSENAPAVIRAECAYV